MEEKIKEKINKEPEIIEGMFSKLVGGYDIANRIMSLGQDLKWRRNLAKILYPQGKNLNLTANTSEELILKQKQYPQVKILDLATGTGDQLILNQKQYPDAKLTGVDFSANMLKVAEKKYIKQFSVKPELILADATKLPLADNSFEGVSISFGLRNINNREELYKEVLRVLKPKGRFLALEVFYDKNTPWAFFYKIYLKYFIASILKRQDKSYQYLAQSVLNFPVPKVILKEMEENGFVNTGFKTFMLKSVMLVWGEKV